MLSQKNWWWRWNTYLGGFLLSFFPSRVSTPSVASMREKNRITEPPCILYLSGPRIWTLSVDSIRGKMPPQHGVTSVAIMGDGDRKYWDPRAPMMWDNFSIFGTNCATPDDIYPRGRCNVCDQMTRTCGFFTSMVRNKVGNKNQVPYM